jgi:fimbrial chaperone protein
LNRPLLAAALTAFGLLLGAGDASAAAFGVSPIRVDLDRGSRTGLVNVSNDEDRKLSFQLKLFEWKQNEKGEDVYAESDDLVFFPRILTVDPKSRRAIRIGTRGNPSAPEKAYRLFIEEMPEPGQASAGASQVAVRLRFGVPVFVTAADGEPQIEIVDARTRKGEVVVTVRNSGARTSRLEQLIASSGDKTVGKANGWYVFPGVTRTFQIPVPHAACPVAGAIQVTTQSGGREIRGTAEASPLLCTP